MKPGLRAALTLALLGGCDAPPPNGTQAPETPAKAEAPAEVDPPAEEAAPPPDKSAAAARRDGPPASVDALVAGATAPVMKDLPSTTGPWTRAATPTIVAFYRGHW